MGEAMKPHLSNCAWLQRNFQLGDRLGLVRNSVLPGFSGGRVDGRAEVSRLHCLSVTTGGAVTV